jgi:hypothetical protein
VFWWKAGKRGCRWPVGEAFSSGGRGLSSGGFLAALDFWQHPMARMVHQATKIRDENNFEIFRNSRNCFRFFRSDSLVSVFFRNNIGCRNFDSESVRRFIDHFHWLSILTGIYRIQVLEFPKITYTMSKSQPKPTYSSPGAPVPFIP